MRTLLLIVLLGFSVGCGSAAIPMGAMTTVHGKLETNSGNPVGGILLTLQPLGDGHPAPMEVAENGTFKGDAVPGKYAYYVGKSSAKNSEQSLKKVNDKYQQADMGRTVTVQAGQELRIALD